MDRKKILLLSFIISQGFCFPEIVFSQNFLCRPWENVLNRQAIGDSFTLKINEGIVSFRGEKKPLSFAELVAEHPLHDIFLSPRGELVSIGKYGSEFIVRVFFPAKEVNFFVMSICNEI